MKVKRIIIPLVLVLFLFLLLKGYHLKSLKETFQTTVAPYGFTCSVDKAWVTLNGRVHFKKVLLKDSLGTSFSIDDIVIHSSLLGLLSLQKQVDKGMLTSDLVAKKIKKARVKNIKASYQKYSGGVFTIASVDLISKRNSLNFTVNLPYVEHGKVKLSKGTVSGTIHGSVVELSQANFRSFSGMVSLKGKVDTFKRVHDLNVQFRDLQISELLHTQKMQGICFGSFELDTFNIRELEELNRLYGTGSIEIHNFSQAGEKRFNTALQKLKRLGIRELNFDTIKGGIELKNGRILSEELTFANNDFRLVAKGRYRIKRKSFNVKIDGYLKPHMRSKMKSIVWGALIATETEERKFTGAARGVPDSYVVTVDGKIIKRGINSFFNNIFK